MLCRVQQQAARVDERLEPVEERLRCPPRRRLVGLVAVDGVVPVQVEDRPLARRLAAKDAERVVDRARPRVQLRAGVVVEEPLVGVGDAVVREEQQLVRHARVLSGTVGLL